MKFTFERPQIGDKVYLIRREKRSVNFKLLTPEIISNVRPYKLQEQGKVVSNLLFITFESGRKVTLDEDARDRNDLFLYQEEVIGILENDYNSKKEELDSIEKELEKVRSFS